MLTTATNISDLRREFARIQDAASYIVIKSEWREAVAAELAIMGIDTATATPEQWIDAANAATVVCPKCSGSGEYIWGGTTNGKPNHKGTCYQCLGKGQQDVDDLFRNKKHLLYSISRAI